MEIPNAPCSHQQRYAQCVRWSFIMLLIFIFQNNEGWGFSWWPGGKESACQCRRRRFHLWSRRIPPSTEQLSLCTTTEPVLEPRNCNSWAHMQQLPKPRALEFMLCNRRGHHNKKPKNHNLREASRSPQLQKTSRNNEDPAQPQINK